MFGGTSSGGIYQIKENTNAEQWSHITTRKNPADDASRGLNAERESSNSCWFQRSLAKLR